MPATDPFPFTPETTKLVQPAAGVLSVTPHATNELASVTRGLMVNVAGDVNVTFQDGSTAILTLAAGVVYPFRIRAVKITSTTATGIFGLV